jgi:carbamoylphosphate synthase large subunit
VLDKYGVELIGAKIDSIKKAEDRLLFKDAMRRSASICPNRRNSPAREQRRWRARIRRKASATP